MRNPKIFPQIVFHLIPLYNNIQSYPDISLPEVITTFKRPKQIPYNYSPIIFSNKANSFLLHTINCL